MLADKSRQRFEELFGSRPTGVVLAPGRVNLVGEHTDYNDGFVLPMAVEKGIALAFAPRTDDLLRVHSADVPQTRDLRLAQLRHRVSVEPDRTGHRGGWFGYVAGVAWSMLGAGLDIRGADIALTSDLPMGAGLSSSAALEVGMARALAAVSGIEWDPKGIALMAQRAEREFAGVACGIMDQLVVAAAREDCALFIDCRSLDTRDVRMPAQMSVIIFDSGVRRDLASSAYNERRAACERVADAIRVGHPEVIALRDADLEMLDEVKSTIADEDYRRARHVILENPRPAALAEALTAGDLRRAGEVMGASHESLRDLFAVSTSELDALVEAAASAPGCYGARLTGAGFGGCVIAIADVAAVDSVIERVKGEYLTRCGCEAAAIVTGAAAGARVL